MFAAAGASVDEDDLIVRLDPDLSRALIASAPASFSITSRNPERSVHIGGDSLMLFPAAGPPYVSDRLQGRRPGTAADLDDLIQITQRSEVLHTTTPTVEPQDLPLPVRHLHSTRATLVLSDKPVALHTGNRFLRLQPMTAPGGEATHQQILRQIGRGEFPNDGLAVQLAYGHRRWHAHRHLAEQGNAPFNCMPVDVVELSDAAMLDCLWSENRERADLNPIEQAELLFAKWQSLGTHQAVAEEWGLSRPTVSNKLRLLALPDDAKAAVREADYPSVRP